MFVGNRRWCSLFGGGVFQKPLCGVLLLSWLAYAAVVRADSDEPEFELSGMTFVGSDGAVTTLLLKADYARYSPKEHKVYLRDFHATSTGEGGRQSLDLHSDSGELWLDSSDFRAQGHVRGRTGDGKHFRTAWVVYDRGHDLVRTDAPVIIEDAGGTLRGGGFRYFVREENLKLVGGAAVLQP